MDHPDADRNLLFGLLALQNGFIDRDALVAAFDAWVGDKARPLGRPPRRARGTARPSPRAARGAGRGPPRAATAATPSGAWRRSPSAARPARAWPPWPTPTSTRRSGHVGPGLDADRRPRPHGHLRRRRAPPPTASGSASSGPHARGGLGEVFVALDERAAPRGGPQADPRPATPTTRPAASGSCWRPRSPAGWSTRASCRSTAWAPTPTAGPTTPCGSSAATASRRPSSGSTPTRRRSATPAVARWSCASCCGRFLDVCNAIDYAHSRGVLHRDLKPGNIMVGKYGETLVVDWGLAKATGPVRARVAPTSGPLRALARPAASAETLPGSAAGHAGLHEPRAGRAATSTRSGRARDVYSLGATLYCLLTGQAAVRGGDVGDVLPGASSGASSRRPGSSTRRSTRRWRRSA